MLVTLADLRAQSRELANMEKSNFVKDTKNGIDWRINSAGQELYGIIVDEGGFRFARQQPIYAIAGQEAYVLTQDAKAIFEVQYKDRPILDYGFNEPGRATTGAPRYRIEELKTLRLYPAPLADGPDVRVMYFPAWPILVDALDTAEVWDWDEYVTTAVAIGLLGKEESSAQALMIRKQELESRIRMEAKKRDLRNGTPVVDLDHWGGPVGDVWAGGGW